MFLRTHTLNTLLLEAHQCSDRHLHAQDGEEELKIGREGCKSREIILQASFFLPALLEREGAGAHWLPESRTERIKLKLKEITVGRKEG